MSSSSSVVNGIATAVNLLCDLAMLGEAADTLLQAVDHNENPLLETATLINSLALVGFSATEIGGLCAGLKSETLQKIKSGELLPRALNVPLQCGTQLMQVVREEDENHPIELRHLLRVMEKGLVAPLADMSRTAASAEAYYEQHFLDMTPEELKKAERPIYKLVDYGEDAHWKIVGYKPVDPEECKRNLQSLHTQFVAATVVRVAARNSVVERVVCDLGIPTIQRLAAFFGWYAPIGQNPGGGAGGPGGAGIHPAGGAASHDVVEQELNIDLVNFPNIPEPLHGDEVLQLYVCPITQRPIRDPVRDPTNNITLYERSAIVNWLRQNPVSPITKLPLRIEDLLEAPVERNLINQRLQEYQDALHHFFEEHAAAPIGD